MSRAALSFVVFTSLVAACSDDPGPGLGATCDSNADCQSGLCFEAQCIDPNGDLDDDSLTNQVEIGLGSSPMLEDTDADNIDDADEVTGGENIDSDGDGAPDILEHADRDEDEDCLGDQEDPENTVTARPRYCEPEFELSVSGDDLACPSEPDVEFSAYSADQNWTELVEWSVEIDGIPTTEVTFSAPGVASVSTSATTTTIYTVVAATRQSRAVMPFLYVPDDTVNGGCVLPE